MIPSPRRAPRKRLPRSGGEKARVALACFVLTPNNVLVLDEPSNHLDVDTVAALAAGLNAFEGAVIVVSHDRAFVDELKADPLYGRWFSTDADKPADKPAEAAAPPKARRKPAANPNAGAAQPKAPVGQMTAEAYGNLRAKHGRKAGRVALELLRKQGIVK